MLSRTEFFLNTMEQGLRRDFQEINLIGELDWTEKKVERLGTELRNIIVQNDIANVCKKYKASMLVLLVFVGIYRYNTKYWGNIEQYMSRKSDIEYLKKNLFKMLREFNFPTFENLEGYKYVTPIICHALIPQQSLEIFFDALYDTLDDLDYMGEHAVEEFKYNMNYKLHKSVIRYFDYLSDKADLIFQAYREMMLRVERDELTKEEVLEEYCVDIPERIIHFYWDWKDTDRTKQRIIKRRDFYFSSPKLKVDLDGFGVYMVLPEQKIRVLTDSKVEWQIFFGGQKEVLVVADLLKFDGDYLSEEKQIQIIPAKEYHIKLVYNGEVINSWDFRGLEKEYMCFDKRNSVIKKDYLPNEEVILLISNQFELDMDKDCYVEIISVPHWSGYTFYCVDLKNQQEVKITSENMEILVKVRKSISPYLVGGDFLFNESNEDKAQFEHYINLPTLFIQSNSKYDLKNWKIIIKEKYSDRKNVKRVALDEVANSKYKNDTGFFIPLQNHQLIPEKQFGEYELKVYNDKTRIGTNVVIRYVPLIECEFDSKNYLPNGKKGYKTTELYCKYSINVDLNFDNAEYKGQVVKNKRMYHHYIANIGNQYITGNLSFKRDGNAYDFLVRKRIRPISWGWIGLGNGEINQFVWETNWRKISIEDLEKNVDVYLIIQADTLDYENLIGKVQLLDNSNTVVQEEIISIKESKNVRVSMNSFLSTIQGLKNDHLYLILKIKNTEGEELTQFLLSKFQEELVFSNLDVYKQMNGLKLEWKEDSSLKDRDMIFYNLHCPWEEPIKVSIPDNQTSLFIHYDELAAKEYGVQVKYQDDGWFFEPEPLEIPQKRTLGLVYSVNINEKARENSIYKSLFQLFKGFSNGNLDKNILDNQYPLTISSEEIKAISVSFIFFIKNKKEFYAGAKKIAFRFFDVFVEKYSKGELKYTILKEIVKLNLIEKDFSYLVQFWQLLNIPYVDKPYFTPSHMQYIWDKDKYLGFLVELRTRTNDKSGAMKRIGNWIGDSTLMNLLEDIESVECENAFALEQGIELRNCLQKVLWDECDCRDLKIRIDERTIGAIQQVHEFFEALNSARKFGKEEVYEEAYEEYLLAERDKGIPIFQKTYLKTMIDFNLQHSDNSYRTKIERKIQQLIKSNIWTTVDNYLSYGSNKIIYDHVFKRQDFDGDELPFYCGVVAYLQWGYAKRKDLSILPEYMMGKLINTFYQNYHDLYLRDCVLFELYGILRGDS